MISKRSRLFLGKMQGNFSPCRKRSPAKGVWQKSDEISDRSIRKKWPRGDRNSPETKKSDRTPFADLLLRHPELSGPMLRAIARLSQRYPLQRYPLLWYGVVRVSMWPNWVRAELVQREVSGKKFQVKLTVTVLLIPGLSYHSCST